MGNSQIFPRKRLSMNVADSIQYGLTVDNDHAPEQPPIILV